MDLGLERHPHGGGLAGQGSGLLPTLLISDLDALLARKNIIRIRLYARERTDKLCMPRYYSLQLGAAVDGVVDLAPHPRDHPGLLSQRALHRRDGDSDPVTHCVSLVEQLGLFVQGAILPGHRRALLVAVPDLLPGRGHHPLGDAVLPLIKENKCKKIYIITSLVSP